MTGAGAEDHVAAGRRAGHLQGPGEEEPGGAGRPLPRGAPRAPGSIMRYNNNMNNNNYSSQYVSKLFVVRGEWR